MKKVILYSLLMLVIAVMLSGCSSQPLEDIGETSQTSGQVETQVEEAPIEKISVYTSIYPLYEFATYIGGQVADVNLMVPAGAEPHDFEPSAKLTGRVEQAKVFIYNGAGMEPWVEAFVGAINADDLIVVNTSDEIELLPFVEFDFDDIESHKDHGHEDEDHEDEDHSEDDGHGHGDFDPHVWLDPQRAKIQAHAITQALIKALPSEEAYFTENFNQLSHKFDTLDMAYHEALTQVSNPHVVVGHAAFGYLTSKYNLEQIAIAGLSPLEEPSAAQLAKISDLVASLNIKGIYYDATSQGKLSQVIVEETGVDLLPLHPLGSVFKDDMDAGKGYFEWMYANLEALLKTVK